jgi:hypothetical protein
VSFYLASDGGTPNGFAVQWNGNFLAGQVNIPGHGYQLNSFLLTATGPSTKLTFYEFNNPGYLSLDDVIVKPTSATPEPCGIALASAGILCLGVYVARRRR